MLELVKVNTYYWERHVLCDVSLKVPQGTIVSMLGRNGMGKTTTIRSIMGLTPPRGGEVRFKGEIISGLEPFQIARKGLALVPQGRCVFPSLSVRENLTIVARNTQKSDGWDVERVYSLFPILKQRAGFYANLLSGGEQQMLAIARALITNPELLIMDEPSEGLAPMVVKQIGQIISDLKGKLTVLLAEQNLNMALSLADYVYIISKGTIVYESKPDELKNNMEIKTKHLGV
jgi:branched-chain amino acid transport system ATP-binding protein